MGIHKLAVHAPTRFQNDNLMRAKAEHIKATVQHDGEVWAKTPDAAAFIKRVKGVIASPPGQAHIASGKALKGSFKNLVEYGKKIKTPATKGFHLNNADIDDLEKNGVQFEKTKNALKAHPVTLGLKNQGIAA